MIYKEYHLANRVDQNMEQNVGKKSFYTFYSHILKKIKTFDLALTTYGNQLKLTRMPATNITHAKDIGKKTFHPNLIN